MSKANVERCKELLNLFNEYRSAKADVLRDWRLTRALYKGDFWDKFREHLKDYSLTPDWNYYDYTVQAYLNSIYSGAFIGTLTPTKSADTEVVAKMNAFLSYNWNKWGMKNKFLHIGENGELYNLGAIRVDWDSKHKNIKLQEILPEEIYFDPTVRDFREGQAVFIERSININKLRKDTRFKDEVEKYLKNNTRIYDKSLVNKIAQGERGTLSKNTTVSLIECFIRNEKGKMDQVFILNEDVIIYDETISLCRFPISVYTPQRPDGNPYGMSKLKKIRNTVIVLNIIDMMEATQPYRLMNRAKFVNVDGRINMRSFAEYGNTPGATFQVKGDPNGLIKYLDVPALPDMTNLKARLENSIFQVTGVDPYYKGRMTNSIQTTGATQAFQARVTMLTDNSRITLLEEFCEDLTRLILEYYTAFSSEATYDIPIYSATGTKKVIKNEQVSFAQAPRYDYNINASVLLPMNQANLFESAKALYEMQGQYQFKTQVITEQDLIRYSDFPQKDEILDRLEADAQSNTAQDLIADLTNFATIFSKLLASGVEESQAAEQAIQILIEEKNAMMQDPSLGRGFQ